MATTEFSKFAGILSAAFKSSSFFLKFLFIYSFSAVLSLCCSEGFPLAVVSGGCSLVVVLLIAMAFSCCTTWALGAQALVVAARGMSSCGSTVVPSGLNCSKACGIFPDQGLKLCLLHWQADSFFFFLIFLKFYFIFKLYIIVLVLPNIKMNPSQVYMCSPS